MGDWNNSNKSKRLFVNKKRESRVQCCKLVSKMNSYVSLCILLIKRFHAKITVTINNDASLFITVRPKELPLKVRHTFLGINLTISNLSNWVCTITLVFFWCHKLKRKIKLQETGESLIELVKLPDSKAEERTRFGHLFH